MIGISDIKSGKNIILNGVPFAVLYHEHSKTGRAGAVFNDHGLAECHGHALLQQSGGQVHAAAQKIG